MPLPAVVVLLVVALVGLLGARTGRPALFAVAGGVGLIASILQLVQFGRSPNWLGGNGSTAAFLAGLGIGFCALWYAARESPVPDRAAGADRAWQPGKPNLGGGPARTEPFAAGSLFQVTEAVCRR